MIIQNDASAPIESIFKGKSGAIIIIYRFGHNDYCAVWNDEFSVRGTFHQILEEIKQEV